MKVQILDVAADEGGAMTVLKGIYEAARMSSSDAEWVLHVSTPHLPRDGNVTVRSHPWVKKSWCHRLLFEATAAHRARRDGANLILSLQNIGVFGTKIRQVVYVHQSLGYIADRFRFRDFPIMWIYQNVISLLIDRSVMIADLVIVQSQWMKTIMTAKLKKNPDDIVVIPPVAPSHTHPRPKYNDVERSRLFVYPAGPQPYKNHAVVAQACDILLANEMIDFRMVFTITEKESSRLKVGTNAAVDFAGHLTPGELSLMYSQAIVIFASTAESFGFPLLEARTAGSIVLAADTPFAREVLEDYENVHYYDPYSALGLASLMKSAMDGGIAYKSVAQRTLSTHDSWDPVLRRVLEVGPTA